MSHVTIHPVQSKEELLSEMFLYNPDGVEAERFPSIVHFTNLIKQKNTHPSLYLSVVVPAMNEEERLPAMLDECLPYLRHRSEIDACFTFEVIVVDDGSQDRTADIAYKYSLKYGNNVVRVLKLKKNLGKGGAVRSGVLRSRGSMILFVDADGATRFSDFERLEEELLRTKFNWSFPAVAIGSRAYMEKESMVMRSFFRAVLMVGFHLMVYIFAVKSVHDTQCGFKLFTRAAAAKLFVVMHIERWAFDVELLYLAEHFHFPIREVAVQWHEVDGSKIIPIYSWLQMGRDVVLIWFRYFFGIWSYDKME
ncbi:unnamed protein product [Dracunculus medinensis]|uniref:dolichyl-phosphate beta-glucosyltransferase n=1 Tax=Dracunculus medinensis TaxID=318479 RepID=A0A3P7PS65_DRAME|nr:unnamed protein product [Dracunculus medinensis]